MKTTALAIFLLTSLTLAEAQQNASREDALKAAFMASVDLKQMLNTPIPTDPDVKRPVLVREGESGGMILPETKLSRAVLAKAGKDVVPIGQLWLRKVALLVDGQAVKSDKLQLVTVGAAEQTSVVVCALGIRKDSEGKMELLVYGKEKQPILRLPLKEISGQQDNPIEMSAQKQGDGVVVELRILGQYQASLSVAQD